MTVSANLLPNGKQQFLDGDGNPLGGGKVFFYVPGTTTPKDTWQDDAKASLNTNPVLLDANGEAIIFGDGVYRQVLQDAFGTTVWDTTTLQFISFSGGDLEGQLPDPTLRDGVVAEVIQDAPSKGSLVGADEFPILDSQDDFTLANVTWTVMLAAILAYVEDQGTFAAPSAPGAGLSGLSVVVNSNTNVTATAASCSVANSSGDFINLNGVNATANIASSGAGGLDTGTEAASTWYNVFVIYDSDTENVALLISLSATAPTMPTGYTYWRRVGAIRNDSSSNLWRTIQKGARSQIAVGSNPTTAVLLTSGVAGSVSTPTWVAVDLTNFVPPTAGQAQGWVTNVDGSTHNAIVAPNGSYGAYNSTTNPPPVAGVTSVQSVWFDFVLESTSIYWASADSHLYMYLRGWTDNL